MTRQCSMWYCSSMVAFTQFENSVRARGILLCPNRWAFRLNRVCIFYLYELWNIDKNVSSPLFQSRCVVPASLWQSFPCQWSWGGDSCQCAAARLWRWKSCDILGGCDDSRTLLVELGAQQSHPPTSAAGKSQIKTSVTWSLPAWNFDLHKFKCCKSPKPSCTLCRCKMILPHAAQPASISNAASVKFQVC